VAAVAGDVRIASGARPKLDDGRRWRLAAREISQRFKRSTSVDVERDRENLQAPIG
jgi:hypothetical protein